MSSCLLRVTGIFLKFSLRYLFQKKTCSKHLLSDMFFSNFIFQLEFLLGIIFWWVQVDSAGVSQSYALWGGPEVPSARRPRALGALSAVLLTCAPPPPLPPPCCVSGALFTGNAENHLSWAPQHHLDAFSILCVNTVHFNVAESLVFHQRGGHFFRKVQKEL